MGGTNSFPELALCSQEVFGLDIDVLSWDYGMVRSMCTVQVLIFNER